MLRTVIVRGPRVGKTTLSAVLARQVDVIARHTDDLIGSTDAESAVVRWLSSPGPWVIEGVTAVRTLRRWLRENEGAPCEQVFWSDRPKVEQTRGQRTMAKGCATVWSQIHEQIVERGVIVQRF